MDVSAADRRVLAALEEGLPLVPRPFAVLARLAGLDEGEVLARLGRLIEAGVIRRLGLVVRHRELGYRANAMVVWDIPDDRVAAVGRSMGRLPFVTLCYRRPRRPEWPYNLYCMIHGRARAEVRAAIAAMARDLDLEDAPREILFSRRRFKQTGAHYAGAEARRSLEAGTGVPGAS